MFIATEGHKKKVSDSKSFLKKSMSRLSMIVRVVVNVVLNSPGGSFCFGI